MNQAELKSPRISHLSWGHVEVEGHPPFKDTKVFPGGAREWDWRETGTRHVPGIQPADVQELIEHGAKAVVLSKGIWERLQVCPETLEVLVNKGIAVEVLQTETAVERFNELRSFRSGACFIRPTSRGAFAASADPCPGSVSLVRASQFKAVKDPAF